MLAPSADAPMVPASYNTAHPERAARYFFWVDFLRGVAATAVLVFHFRHLSQSVAAPLPFQAVLALFYRYGDAAVLLFWVISGLVFASVYLDAVPQVSARDFFVHRLARLYPLHLLTLLVVAALQIFSWHELGHFEIYEYNDLYHFMLNLGFISSWGLERGFSFNAPIWSVSVEVFIYIVFFLTIPLVARNRGAAPTLVCLFGMLLALKVPLVNFWLCGLSFYLGCCVFRGWQFLERRGPVAPAVVGACGVLAVILAATVLRPLRQHVIAVELLIFPPLVLLFAAVDRLDVWCIGRRVRVFGDLSYSLYLWHIPLQILMLIVLQMNGTGPLAAYPRAFFIAYLLSVFGIAGLSFRYVEYPARRLVRRAFA